MASDCLQIPLQLHTQISDGSWYTDKEANKRTHVTQYHSVITSTTDRRWLGEFARAVNIVELLGLSVAQIIASASNFYSLGTGLSKRYVVERLCGTGSVSWCCTILALVPSARICGGVVALQNCPQPAADSHVLT